MSISTLIRWSGLVAILGGILSVAVYLSESVLILSEADFSIAKNGVGWVVLFILGLVSAVTVLLGLVGIYARQAQACGVLGVIGFIVAFVAVALWTGVSFVFAFVMPELANIPFDVQRSSVVTVVMPGSDIMVPLVTSVGLLTTILICMLGWLLFGLATVRGKVFSQWAGLLLAVGGFSFVFPWIGWIVIGGTLIWMGYSVWSSPGEPSTQLR